MLGFSKQVKKKRISNKIMVERKGKRKKTL